MNTLLELNGVLLPTENGDLRLDLKLFPGEVHALLGGPSSGAAECALLLCGAQRPAAGEWSFLGRPALFRSEREALRAGLAVSRGLWTTLRVRDVLRLFLPEKARAEAALPALRKALPGLDLRKPAGTLDPEDRFRLLLLLSRSRGDRLLVLVDPMRGLKPDFYDTAADLMKDFAGDDRGVLLISDVPRHAMLCDNCTVLRDGEKVYESPCADTGVRRIRQEMTPPDRPMPASLREKTAGAVVLECRSLSGGRRKGHPGAEAVSLELREGEITGLCALPGQGGEELLALLAGTLKSTEGRLRLLGRVPVRYTRGEAIRAGVRFVPGPDPGPAPGGRTVREAVLCGRPGEGTFFSDRGLLLPDAADRYVRFILKEYCPGAAPEALLSDCSPVQRRLLSLAGELDREGPVLLLDHPLRGLDGPGRALIKGCLEDEKLRRTAVLVYSDQMDELLDLCDRLLVMHRGRIVLETDCQMASRHEISLAMSGKRASGELVPDEAEEEEE